MHKCIGRHVGVCSAAQSCPTICDPMGYSPPGSSCSWNFSGKNTGVGCHFPPPGDLLNPGIKSACLVSPALAKPLLLCLTLCDPMDYSPPGSPVPGIRKARILEWAAVPSSQADSILYNIGLCQAVCFCFLLFSPQIAISWVCLCSQFPKDFELCNILSLRTARIYLIISLCGHHF